MPVDLKESFSTVMQRMKAEKAKIEKRQADLLNERYDLGDRPAKGVTHVARQAGAGGRARQAAARA